MPVDNLQSQLRVIPIELEIQEGYEYWLGLKNYQAISRYNRSKLYIMAVFEFSESLAEFL
jgi:membrane-bound lytic murein transglycosylase B